MNTEVELSGTELSLATTTIYKRNEHNMEGRTNPFKDFHRVARGPNHIKIFLQEHRRSDIAKHSSNNRIIE